MLWAMMNLPTYDDVVAAAGRLEGHAHRTPVLRSWTADQMLGAQVFFKCENFQRMGAFKFRGAFNALSKFSQAQRKGGVVTFSSGNHAQAIALSARMLGIPAVILMPMDAPRAKKAATEGYGAEVIVFDRFKEDREALTKKVAAERGMTLIPPYDHEDVISGQGHCRSRAVRRSRRAGLFHHLSGRRRPAQWQRAFRARPLAQLQDLRRGARSRQ